MFYCFVMGPTVVNHVDISGEAKYINKIIGRNKENNSTYFTFSILFDKYKREEVEIRHVPSCYDKNQIPSLTTT